jgi:hypothetical protein
MLRYIDGRPKLEVVLKAGSLHPAHEKPGERVSAYLGQAGMFLLERLFKGICVSNQLMAEEYLFGVRYRGHKII